MMKTLISIAKSVVPKPALLFTEQIILDEPVVFVANHEKNYGPAMMQLFFPIRYRPWIIYNMLEEEVCQPYIQETFFEERLGWPTWLSKPVSRVLSPILIQWMHYTNPVPVYRGKPERIVETFRQSITALENGDNLLIFPEKPDADPFSAEINEFFDGFLYLAKLYYRKTHKKLLFCPVSINPKADTISVGKMIRYNPEIEYATESENIRTHLMQQVAGLYNPPWASEKQHFLDLDYQPNQELQPKPTT